MAVQSLNTDLEAIFEGLCSGVPGSQYSSYLELCEHREAADAEAAGRLFREGRAEAHPWLIRYLVDLQSRRSVEVLLDLARRHEGSLRQRLFDAVRQVPDKIQDKIDVLIEAVGDHDPGIESFVIGSLGKSRSMKAVLRLIERAGEVESPDLVVDILTALENIRDPRAVRTGLWALGEDTPEIVRHGLLLLGEIGDKRDLRRIRPLAGHEQASVRVTVMIVLAKFGHSRDHKLLTQILKTDPEASVRVAAARGLKSWSQTSTARDLLEAITHDGSLLVRKAAGFSLTDMPDAAVLPALIQAADAQQNESLRRVALEHISLRPSPLSRDVLRRALEPREDLEIRVAAASALGKAGDLQDLESLEGLLEVELPLAYAAAGAICNLVQARHLDRLMEILDRHPGLPEALEQVILQHLDRVASVRLLPEGLLAWSRGNLVQTNMNSAYLSLKILGKCGTLEDLSSLDPFFGMDQDSRVRREARLATTRIMVRHADKVHAELTLGELPDLPSVWVRLQALDIPEDQQAGWISALALYLRIPDRVGELFEMFVASLDLEAPADPGAGGSGPAVEQPVPSAFRDEKRDVWLDMSPIAEDEQIVVESPVEVEARDEVPDDPMGLEFDDDGPAEPQPPIAVDDSGETPTGLMADRRPWAVLMLWIRRWPDALPKIARTLPETEAERVPMLLGLRHVARKRRLTSDELRLIADGFASSSPSVRRLALECVSCTGAPELLEPLVDLALSSKEPHERQRAREVMSESLGQPR